MTNFTEVAKESVADLHREAPTERPAGSARAAGPERDTPRPHARGRGSPGRALSTLGMPIEEIQAVLRANDPAVVARYMELHRERLAEQLAHRVRELEALEQILARRSRVAGP